jgi:hypothetical protein
MGGIPQSRRRVFALLFGLTLGAGLSARADAAASPVALGEVKVARSDPSLERTFRGMVERELGEVDLSQVKAPGRFVLSASLVQIATRESSGQAETLAVVSATLRRARGGSIHAVIQGRAQASDGRGKARSVELSAMRAAVRSALGRLPAALK